MAQTRNVVINFITKLQENGLQKMSRQTYGLDRSLKKLRNQLIGIVGFTQLFRYLKASTKAFAEETGEVRQLSLALNNLGFAYSALTVESTIKDLQRLTAVSDGELRPALARLSRVTGNVTEATDLLSLAIDVSIGSGNSLEAVTRALGKAYNGELTSLKRLGINLKASTIASKDFAAAQAELNDQFGGAAAADLTTYNGKMRALGVTSETVKEIIGEGVIKTLETLTDGDFADGLATLEKGAQKVANAFGSVARFVAATKLIMSQGFFMDEQEELALRNIFAPPDAAKTRTAARERAKAFAQEQAAIKRLSRLREQEERKKQAKEATKKAQEAADALKKRLESKFDIENINLAAAAQKNLSDADRARVEALQALKTEGVKDDEASLNKLIELEKKREAEIQRQARESIIASAAVKNQRLADLQAELDALIKLSQARAASIAGTAVSAQNVTSPTLQIEPTIPANIAEAFIALSLAGQAEQQGAAALSAATAVGQQITVIQNIQGNVTTERELFDNYVDAIFQINRQGTNSQLVNLGR
jgi:hypothetical protein